jgi:uncharacterized protein YbgA (DUF1722 family)/uncharacterized protein YbbK (DUF523 family)
MADKIRLGISTCLLGEPVRYDGQHRLDRYLRDTLGQYVEFVPVCPEVEAGFGVPRPTMRLEGDPEAPRLVAPHDGTDQTEKMLAWCRVRVEELAGEGLCGFVFKSKSPSSGMERVKVYGPSGMPRKVGVGLFARAFMDRFPLLPVEEEGRLHDAALRENFVERIFVMQRWRRYRENSPTLGGLVAFHTVHKLLLMSHSVEAYRAIGRLVAAGKGRPFDEVLAEYEAALLPALKLLATRAKNTNVLQHAMGYLKKLLEPDEKAELLELIEAYRTGTATLAIPMTLLNHYVRKFGIEYLAGQVYLHPHPTELQLRNHA